MKITELDIYSILSYNIWKSPRQIRDELAKAKGINQQSKYFRLGLASIYTHLNHLEDQGFIDSRERRIREEVLRTRGGPELEYKLTSDGLRNKQDLRQENEGLDGILCTT